MKKSTVEYIIALLAFGIGGGMLTAYGWDKHVEYVEKTKLI